MKRWSLDVELESTSMQLTNGLRVPVMSRAQHFVLTGADVEEFPTDNVAEICSGPSGKT